MKLINNTNTCATSLVLRKENSLSVIHKFTNTTIRISSKAIFGAIVLTLLNLVI